MNHIDPKVIMTEIKGFEKSHDNMFINLLD